MPERQVNVDYTVVTVTGDSTKLTTVKYTLSHSGTGLSETRQDVFSSIALGYGVTDGMTSEQNPA